MEGEGSPGSQRRKRFAELSRDPAESVPGTSRNIPILRAIFPRDPRNDYCFVFRLDDQPHSSVALPRGSRASGNHGGGRTPGRDGGIPREEIRQREPPAYTHPGVPVVHRGIPPERYRGIRGVKRRKRKDRGSEQSRSPAPVPRMLAPPVVRGKEGRPLHPHGRPEARLLPRRGGVPPRGLRRVPEGTCVSPSLLLSCSYPMYRPRTP